MEVKIMEWNIHQQGRWGKRIPLWILDEIPQDINILTLTEFNGHAENIDEFYKKIKKLKTWDFITAILIILLNMQMIF